MTAVAEIKTQQALNDLFAGVREDFARMRWQAWLDDETRRLEQRHRQTMTNETDPVGRKHAALAQSTIDRKGHSRILFETNRLYESLVSPNAEFSVRFALDEWPAAKLIYGTDAPYAEILSAGTERMPARPMVGMHPQRVEHMTHRAADHAVKELTK